jgi:hypothetical protein
MASRTVLIAAAPFSDRLDGAVVACAIGRGLQTNGDWELDSCPLEADDDPTLVRASLEELSFDERMRASHAIVLARGRLDHAALRGSAAFEIATRARQGGVPAYAVVAGNGLDPFEARILDLQLIIEAATARALAAAGGRLAQLI